MADPFNPQIQPLIRSFPSERTCKAGAPCSGSDFEQKNTCISDDGEELSCFYVNPRKGENISAFQWLRTGRNLFNPKIKPLITRVPKEDDDDDDDDDEKEDDDEGVELVGSTATFPANERHLYHEWEQILGLGTSVPDATFVVDDGNTMVLEGFLKIYNDVNTTRWGPPLSYTELKINGVDSITVNGVSKQIDSSAQEPGFSSDRSLLGSKLTWLNMDRKTLDGWFSTLLPGVAAKSPATEEVFDPDEDVLSRYNMTMDDIDSRLTSLKTFLTIYNDESTLKKTPTLSFKEYKDSITVTGFSSSVSAMDTKYVEGATPSGDDDDDGDDDYDGEGIQVTNVLTYYKVGKSKKWQTGTRYKNVPELKVASDVLKSKPGATAIVLARYSFNTRDIDDPDVRSQVEDDKYYSLEINWQQLFRIAAFRVSDGQLESFGAYASFTGTESELLSSALPDLETEYAKHSKKKEPVSSKKKKKAKKEKEDDGSILIKPTGTKKTIAAWENLLFGKKTVLKYGRVIDVQRFKDGSPVSWDVYMTILSKVDDDDLLDNPTLWDVGRRTKKGIKLRPL